MGSADRVIRTVLAIVFGVLILTGQVEGTFAIILGVFAVGFLLTSAFSFCPVYALLKISTNKAALQK
jgi:hypothetical protein